jgi:hypothetical protein
MGDYASDLHSIMTGIASKTPDNSVRVDRLPVFCYSNNIESRRRGHTDPPFSNID